VNDGRSQQLLFTDLPDLLSVGESREIEVQNSLLEELCVLLLVIGNQPFHDMKGDFDLHKFA